MKTHSRIYGEYRILKRFVFLAVYNDIINNKYYLKIFTKNVNININFGKPKPNISA